ANPHPDLADAYLRPGDSAREKLERIEALAAMAPGDAEAAIAVARAALDAKEFTIGKQALAPFTGSPTKRVAALMAALELQSGDEGRGREGMARALSAGRDPAWTADGFVSDHWLPISPVTGRLDAFEWKDPLAGDEHAGAVIDAERHAMLEPPAASSSAAAAASAAMAAAAAAIAAGATTSSGAGGGEGDSPRTESAEAPAHPARGEREHIESGAGEPLSESQPASPPPVIPLVQAPDDPGPNSNAVVPPDPAPEGPDAPPAD